MNNRNPTQKTACELKHFIKRYEEICGRIIASTAFHVKCLFITLVWMQQFRCF